MSEADRRPLARRQECTTVEKPPGIHRTKAGEGFIAEPGTGYCFDPNERHGAEVLEDSEVIECFAPKRPEYVGG